MQSGRARTLLASVAALVVLAGAGVGCSSSGGSSSSGNSDDPCQQVVNDAVAAWKDYSSKHGTDLQNAPEDAKDDLKTLTDQVQALQTKMAESNCNADQVGQGIQEKAPDFLGANRQNSTTPPTTAP